MERIIINQSTITDGSVFPPAVYISNQAVTVIRPARKEIPYCKRYCPLDRCCRRPCRPKKNCGCHACDGCHKCHICHGCCGCNSCKGCNGRKGVGCGGRCRCSICECALIAAALIVFCSC